jgi:hypothetical protein
VSFRLSASHSWWCHKNLVNYISAFYYRNFCTKAGSMVRGLLLLLTEHEVAESFFSFRNYKCSSATSRRLHRARLKFNSFSGVCCRFSCASVNKINNSELLIAFRFWVCRSKNEDANMCLGRGIHDDVNRGGSRNGNQFMLPQKFRDQNVLFRTSSRTVNCFSALRPNANALRELEDWAGGKGIGTHTETTFFTVL